MAASELIKILENIQVIQKKRYFTRGKNYFLAFAAGFDTVLPAMVFFASAFFGSAFRVFGFLVSVFFVVTTILMFNSRLEIVSWNNKEMNTKEIIHHSSGYRVDEQMSSVGIISP